MAEEWCDALKCHNDEGKEIPWLEVKPKVGRAIFWYNIDAAGNMDINTLHAGAKVTSGTKVGLNIWTREGSWRKRRS